MQYPHFTHPTQTATNGNECRNQLPVLITTSHSTHTQHSRMATAAGGVCEQGVPCNPTAHNPPGCTLVCHLCVMTACQMHLSDSVDKIHKQPAPAAFGGHHAAPNQPPAATTSCMCRHRTDDRETQIGPATLMMHQALLLLLLLLLLLVELLMTCAAALCCCICCSGRRSVPFAKHVPDVKHLAH